MLKEDVEYEEQYGHLPNTTEDLLLYLEKTKKLNFDEIERLENKIDALEWIEYEMSFPIIPKGSPRPRRNGNSNIFYVKGAKKTKKRIKKWVKELPIICTRVEYRLDVYQPTPKAMTNSEMYLAEKKIIRPIAKPDWDNVSKTFTDCLEGILLLNDNQINPGHVEKYYSIKPRVNIFIRYQNDFDCEYNRKKVMKSIAYMDMISNNKLS